MMQQSSNQFGSSDRDNNPFEPWQTPTEDMQLAPEAGLPSSESVISVPNEKSWRWFLMGLSVCCAAGGMAIGAFIWLISLPPAAECQKISSFSPDRDRLYCAQEAVRTGDVPELLSAIELVENWSSNHPLYPQAQESLTEWSEAVLHAARQKVDDNDLNGAIELASQVPKASPIRKEAQAAIAEWRNQWKQGEAIYAKAIDAIKQQNWDRATEQITALSGLNHEYWRLQQTKNLSRRVTQERQAQQYFEQALELAESGKASDLAKAIARVSEMNRGTFVWTKAQPTFNQWSETLITAGLQQWKAKKLDAAIALGREVARNPNFAKDAQHLIWLSQARKEAIASLSNWETSPKQIWHLIQASMIASQIAPDSRFYPQAQASLKHWQAQLQDLTQLQTSQLLANFQQLEALNLAIDQAQAIAPTRPRRVQAQTLVAHWKHQTEEMEDRPHLTKAYELAAPGTIPALREAIVEAQRVAPNRALRRDAQTLIATWQNRIQTLEDEPILNRARRMAAQGDLNDAIQEASVIQPGRALYDQAQSFIGEWRGRIRAIERARLRENQQREAAERARRSVDQSGGERTRRDRRSQPANSVDSYRQNRAPERSVPAPSDYGAPPAQSAPPEEIPSTRSLPRVFEAPPAPPPAVEPAPPPPPVQAPPVNSAPPILPSRPSPVQVSPLPAPSSPENIEQDPYSRFSSAPADATAVYAGALYAGMV